MAIFKALTFDGVNSLDYGIYITGEAVYNAPERAVEMVNIPGKNGALALDQGRFENIEVTYHAGCFADSQADFADKVMKFRNALASRYTYKRLTDEYHTDEYRLGLYKSGLEVDAVHYSTAGEFDITFDCKPQRFLTSGETALTLSDYIDTQTATGEIVTIESDGSLGVKSLNVALEPIQSGSGTPSPDNVRPISGRDSVVTQRTGKNLLPNDIESYTLGSTYRYITRIMPDGVRAYMSFTDKDASVNVSDISVGFVHGYSGGSVRLFRWCLNDGSVSDHSNVAAADTSVLCEGIIIYPRTEDAFNRLFARYDIMIELGTTATAYEPYNGNTYTTDLGRTVYGGTLDVVSGELTVTHGIVDLGTLTWNVSNNIFYSTGINSLKAKGVSNIICEAYPTSTKTSWSSVEDMHCVGNVANGNIYIKDINYSSSADFKTAMNGIHMCYELSSPQTYQLTPTEVELLLGTNNLWTDCGETSVEYGIPPYYNPTEFDAKPLIKVTGRGTLGIGEYILTITGTVTQTLYIDCETMEIYTYEGTVPTGASSLVSINRNDFPVLEPGTNYISVGSGITAVTIKPRWWRI